jgi:serine/threonine protein kinase
VSDAVPITADATVDESAAPNAAGEPVGCLVAGRYRLGPLLGRGGMGKVWLAKDELLRRPVALKQVILRREEPQATARRTLTEARAAARVDHSGVVAVYDVVEHDSTPWIVMELLSGRTLAEALRVDGPLPVDEVAHIGLCLLDVLQAVHRAGVVHRDVTPANVYLCEDGRVVLTDFGIAWTADRGSSFLPSEFVGSPPYTPPEGVQGGTLGPPSDLFSLGATLFAAVEGKPAFDKGSVLDTVAAVLADAPAPYRRAGPLRPLINGLLAKKPQHRPSATAASAALRAICPSQPPRQAAMSDGAA